MTPIHFHCPLCSGLFQVSAEMVGGQVICPHCHQQVGIPQMAGQPTEEVDAPSHPPAVPPVPPLDPPPPPPPKPPIPAPPQTSSPPIPQPAVPSADQSEEYTLQEPAAADHPPLPPGAVVQQMYPPGHGPDTSSPSDSTAPQKSPSTQTPKTSSSEADLSDDADRYPPDMPTPTGHGDPAEAGTVMQKATESVPPQPAASNAPIVAVERHEPPASPAGSEVPPAEVDSLLPPGSCDASSPAGTSSANESHEEHVATPESASERRADDSHKETRGALSSTSIQAKRKSEVREPEFSVHEPVQTVGEGPNARPLLTLSRQQRKQRRFITSIVMWSICAFALAAMLACLLLLR